MRVQVLLDRIDRQQRRLQFALVPGTEPVAGAGGAEKVRGWREEILEPKKKASKRSPKALKREKKAKKRR